MRKLIPLLLLALPLPALAQSVITIDTQQCVYHSGDNTAWAAPTLDESDWRPYSEWKSNPHQRHLWVRCHPDLITLRGLEHPAVQVTLFSAYQLYLDGQLVSTVGNLNNGNFNLNAIRSFNLPQNLLAPNSATIALRITDRSSWSFRAVNSTNGALSTSLRMRAGETSVLDAAALRDRLARAQPYLLSTLCWGAIGVAALMLLGLYLLDRSRNELLLISLYCLSIAVFRVNSVASAGLMNYPISAVILIFYSLGQIAATVIFPLFIYSVARRRIPVLLWILIAIDVCALSPGLVDAVLAANQPEWFDPFRITFANPLATFSRMAISFAPFFAFLPFSRLPRRIRPLAIPCLIWGTSEVIWWMLQSTNIPLPGIPNLVTRWGIFLVNIRSFTVAGVLLVLFVLLLREQSQVIQERALLAGEMQAAGEIQRMLAPAAFDCAHGLQIDVAFHPMREVGGDFYLCRVFSDGTQRIVLGDVSGKGSAAAMTAALLLGGAADHDSESPASLLDHLNRVLLDSHVGGFATCLCADCKPDGNVTLANAGHLPPYHRGNEIPVLSGLPLGLTQQQDRYQEFNFSLPDGDTLTLLSDGVVEARNATGELFGFERTRAISGHPASEIAEAAKNFGQEDDITVLTITRETTAQQALAEETVSALAPG